MESIGIQTLVGAVIGMAVSYALLKTYIANVRADHCQDAYEKGWSEGYEIGLQAGKPKRVKKIRKADP